MFVADAHADTLYALAIQGTEPQHLMVNRDRLEKGCVGLQTYALFTGRGGPMGTPYQDGIRMMAKIDALGVPIIRGALPDAPPDTPMGVISVEGGELFEGKIERLREFHAMARIRMIALTWNFENEIGHPSKGGTRNPLKPFGHELLLAMDELGILADVSHLNEAGFYHAAELARNPIIASHSNLKTLCDNHRNLTADQVKLIIEKKGFIGINFYAKFLAKGRAATTDDVLRHIDGIMALGGEHVLGFGSDFDGIDEWPDGLASPADFPALIELLLRHGYSEDQVRAIAGLNLWNVLKRAEAAALVSP